MELTDLVRILRRRWMPIVAAGVVGVGAAAAVSALQAPTYESATQVFVSTQTGETSSDLAQSNAYTLSRVLTYADLHSLFDDPDGRDPGREVELHLTGNMEKFAWSFDGIPFAGAEPLRLNYGERMRIVLVNDTMMQHPIHLHGVWSDLEDAQGDFQLRKHTVDMPPGTRRSYRVRADALGRWAFHCHLLYHMEAGMMREVRIEE